MMWTPEAGEAAGGEAEAVGVAEAAGPAAAVSPGPGAAGGEVAVAVFRGRAEVTSPGHLVLREVLIVPV
jgi:hypothetical protein